MFCTACGTENPPGSRFCANCGAALPADASARTPRSVIGSHGAGARTADGEFSTEAHQGAVDALTPGSALLVVKRGPNAGSRFLLDQDVTTAGRHPDSDIFLDDVTVSRRHAEFRREGSGYTVHDVGSLNGTYVNRERIDAAPLSGGDEVQIGKFRLVYLTAAVRSGVGAGRMTTLVSPSGATASAAGPRATLTIGEVLGQLCKVDFPDLTISKIRFLEDRRAWSSRSARRRATASSPANDVARLRYVLSPAARPLPAAAGDQGSARRHRPRPRAAGTSTAACPRVPHLASIEDNAPTAEHFRPAPAAMRLSRDELLNAAGLHR